VSIFYGIIIAIRPEFGSYEEIDYNYLRSKYKYTARLFKD